jgi:hypothetical protein
MAITDFFPSNIVTNTFFYQNLIPFIVLFAILWGLVEMAGRFKPKINIVIAGGFSLIAVYTNPWILTYIATLGVYMAVLIFGILFLFGIIRWGLGRGKDIYVETASYEKQLTSSMSQLQKIDDKLSSGGLSNTEANELLRRKSDLENKIKILRLRLMR